MTDGAPISGMLEALFHALGNYVKHHFRFKENVNDLRRRLEDLNARKNDVQTRINASLCYRNQVLEQVEKWLERVRSINNEIVCIEEKVHRVPYFFRGKLTILVRQKVAEVKELYEEGRFPEGVVTDRPPSLGITLPTVDLEGHVTVVQKIWEYLMDDGVGMIGIWGIGGVGKTAVMKHIHNKLLGECSRFVKLMWVTVSHPLNVARLQEQIAYAMNQNLSENEEDLVRASRLMDILRRTGEYVLILDDVWDKFSLEDVGIPTPTMENRNKVIITSRSVDLCNYLGCRVVKVEPLSRAESLNLFTNRVGLDILQISPELERILASIVDECAGLPLAIVTIAGSLRGEYDIEVWRYALFELCHPGTGVWESSEEVTEKLKFSYNSLKDQKMQNCFLSCSLYPEDCSISREDLIQHWIDEGLIEPFGGRRAMFGKGYIILRTLENNCLLEKASYEGNVKMHDLMRHMALNITRLTPRFMVKAREGLREIPNQYEWTEDLEKVSLMENNIFEIPLDLSPKCPILTTLLLQRNRSLSQIPECFFENMQCLKVLNLSRTAIEALPKSLCNLKTLAALVLRHCDKLKHLPSLEMLLSLKKLDLHEAGIEVVPEGTEMLVRLQYLDLCCPYLVELPIGLFNKLFCLQYLVVDCNSTTLKIKEREVARLEMLETFVGKLCDLQDFNNYIKSKQCPKQCPRLDEYLLVVGPYPDNTVFIGENCRRRVSLGECQIGGEESLVLPVDLQKLNIYRCNNLRSLTDISVALQNTTELRSCAISECAGIECMVDMFSWSSFFINNLEVLDLRKLPNLAVLVEGKRATAASTSCAPTPPRIFSNLKEIYISRCSRMKKLFSAELQDLHNLQDITVENCEEIEEIIASEEEEELEIVANNPFTLLKLSKLILVELPKLKRICPSGRVMVCDSLQCVQIESCPKLKRIPLVGNLQPSPSALKVIWIKPKNWWESLEWDDTRACSDLRRVVKFLDRPLMESFA